MSKKEARIAREAERRLRQQAASVRLRARPVEEKTPRRSVDPGSIYQMMMRWSIDSADREGTWSWGVDRKWSDETWGGIVKPKLDEFEKLMWREIEEFTTSSGHRSHHSMSRDVICNESQARMVELDHGYDEIYRFRLGNNRRLWGFRIVNMFEILWYGPTHKIYPTEPD